MYCHSLSCLFFSFAVLSIKVIVFGCAAYNLHMNHVRRSGCVCEMDIVLSVTLGMQKYTFVKSVPAFVCDM